ncbi:MAG: outer membrane beta-barrel protein [Pseudomonadota bacterium]|nr:outer membrane beta-barrel protein [Pseudomonadota bacterium]
MKPFLVAGMFILSLGAAGTASGADLLAGEAIPEQAYNPAFDWSGTYAGLHAGGMFADGHITEYDRDTGERSGWTWDESGWGAIAGIYAGYNHVLPNNALVGIEGDLSYTHIDRSRFLDLGGDPDPDYLVGWRNQLQGSLRLRYGIVMDDSLAYITGGVAVSDNEMRFYADGSSSNHVALNEILFGWTLGAGMEHHFGGNWIGRIDYRYTYSGDVAYTPDIDDYDGEYDDVFDMHQHAIVVGLAYKF